METFISLFSLWSSICLSFCFTFNHLMKQKKKAWTFIKIIVNFLPNSDLFTTWYNMKRKKRQPQILIWIILFQMLVHIECHSKWTCIFNWSDLIADKWNWLCICSIIACSYTKHLCPMEYTEVMVWNVGVSMWQVIFQSVETQVCHYITNMNWICNTFILKMIRNYVYYISKMYDVFACVMCCLFIFCRETRHQEFFSIWNSQSIKPDSM